MSGLSGEDRARLEHLAGYCQNWGSWATSSTQMETMGAALTRALALIDQQEKALEAADELAEAAMASPVVQHEDGPMIDYAAYGRRVATAHAAYRSARATSTKEDG